MMFAEDRELHDRIYPEFPASEYEARNKKVRISMEEMGLDALFIAEAKNVEYFTGCMTKIGPRVVIIPADGESLLIVPAYLSGTAEKTSWLRNIQRFSEGHLKKDPNGFVNLIVDSMKKMGLKKGKIGLEYPEGQQFMDSGLHYTEYDHLRSQLNAAEFCSGSKAIWSCRTVKSPLEIERLEKAATITMTGYNRAREKVKIGMTEIEVAGIYRRVFTDMQTKFGHNTGELGILNIRAGLERYPMADTFNQDRKIGIGETLVMNCGAWFRRYYANFSRYAFVGKPSEKHMKAHEAIVESIQAFSDNLAPGIEGQYVHEPAINPLRKSGIGETFDHTGIGVGLYIHEPPYIGAGTTEVMEPGNIFSFQSWMYDVGSGGLGVLGYEHEFLVTEKGCRPIVPIEDDLLWVV
ncbi:MAG: M24 family metallopeptidase [Candidatus Thorarchaeota archaeon]